VKHISVVDLDVLETDEAKMLPKEPNVEELDLSIEVLEDRTEFNSPTANIEGGGGGCCGGCCGIGCSCWTG
jgi:hypothetical protein